MIVMVIVYTYLQINCLFKYQIYSLHQPQHPVLFAGFLPELSFYDSKVCFTMPILIPAGRLLQSMSPVSIRFSKTYVTFMNVGSTLYPVLAEASRKAMPLSLANFYPS